MASRMSGTFELPWDTLLLEFNRGGARKRNKMPPTEPGGLRVECANCKHHVDVNRYILKPEDTWPAGIIHFVVVAEGFVGTVRCPECGHFTIRRD